MQLLFNVIYKWLKSVDSTKTSFQLTKGFISQLYCQKPFFFTIVACFSLCWKRKPDLKTLQWFDLKCACINICKLHEYYGWISCSQNWCFHNVVG